MIGISAGQDAVQFIKVMLVGLHGVGSGVTVVVDLNVVPAHALQDIKGGNIFAVREDPFLPVNCSDIFTMFF
jgi:hypothetical protein